MPRWVLHVDLDQFLAAVELLRHPELRGCPVVVGGDGDPTKRGVVSTASYQARERGVHSGLALRTAARRCPDAVFLPVDKPVYEAVSAEVMATLREVDGVLEVLGWDEAFLGVTSDDPEDLARRIQRRVRSATELDCSVGIGQNKLQAKLASGFAKPAGVSQLTHQTWPAVMGDRPADALWGIGAKTAAKLTGLGIGTVSELAAADPRRLAAEFGPTIGPWLVRTGQGRDPSPVIGDPWVARSRSREVTFQSDLADWASIREAVSRLARQVAADVADEQRDAVRVVVKVRWASFVVRSHGLALERPGRDVAAIEATALAALDHFGPLAPGQRVRLLGVRAEFPR